MNKSDFQEHQKKMLGGLLETARLKQNEYATGENAFHNFIDGVGFSMHTEPESVAWDYCIKHLQSVRDLIKHVEVGGVNGFPTQKIIDEKFGDIIIYMTLMHGMLTERIENYEKEKVRPEVGRRPEPEDQV